MFKKLPSFKIPELFLSERIYSKDFILFFKKAKSFSYQIIIPDKNIVNKPQKNKLKRRVLNILKKIGCDNLPAQTLIFKKTKNKLENNQIEDQLILLKKLLLKKL